MPLYDYKCSTCGVFEILVMDSKEIVKCPNCGEVIQKQVSYKSTFKLCGNGWFKDGYSKKD